MCNVYIKSDGFKVITSMDFTFSILFSKKKKVLFVGGRRLGLGTIYLTDVNEPCFI